MKRYQYFQPNKKDLKDKQGDCAIRALCKFLDKTWLEVFDLLMPIARETQQMLNSKTNIEMFMESNEVAYISKHRSGMRVEDIAKQGITAVCYCRTGFRTHLVTVKDGQYFDTWDSGSRLVYGYWQRFEKAK